MSRVRIPSIAHCQTKDIVSFVSILDAILLGFIQGLTEFLPVSSSGHLKLSQYFLNLNHLSEFLLFDLVCHLGTLGAIFATYHSQIKETIFNNHFRFKQLMIATLPLFPLLLVIKPIKSIFDQVEYLGFFFLITAFILFLGIRFGRTKSSSELREHSWRDALIIGIFQAVAILPGVSRSGSTISGARLLGWSQQEAVTFSFLLAIPTILGGTVVEALQLVKHGTSPHHPVDWPSYAAGFIVSFAVGYLALQWVIRLAAQNKFVYFVWYCLFLGLATTVYFHFLKIA